MSNAPSAQPAVVAAPRAPEQKASEPKGSAAHDTPSALVASADTSRHRPAPAVVASEADAPAMPAPRVTLASATPRVAQAARPATAPRSTRLVPPAPRPTIELAQQSNRTHMVSDELGQAAHHAIVTTPSCMRPHATAPRRATGIPISQFVWRRFVATALRRRRLPHGVIHA